MAVSIIGGSSAASSATTFEGGTQTYAFNKTKAAVTIPIGTIPPADYYVALPAAAYGSITIKSYIGTTPGAILGEYLNPGYRSGFNVTVPAGVTGIYITGSYIGPVIFELIPNPNLAILTDGAAMHLSLQDWSRYYWSPVQGLNYLFFKRDSVSKKITFYNTNTSTFSTSNIQITATDGGFSIYPSIAYGAGLLVTSSGNFNSGTGVVRFYSSSDFGATWTMNTTSIPSGTHDYSLIKFENGYFFAAPTNIASQNFMHSIDGLTWTLKTTSPFNTNNIQIYYGNSLFIIGTNSSSHFTSTDMVTWTARTYPHSGYAPNGFFYANGYWITWSSQGSVYKSTDAITWTNLSTTSYGQIIWYQNGGSYFYNMVSVGTDNYFGGYVPGNYGSVFKVSNTQAFSTFYNSGSTQLNTAAVTSINGNIAVFLYNSNIGNSSWVYTSTGAPISGAPDAKDSATWYGGYNFNDMFWSQTANRWYLWSQNPTGSGNIFYYANATGLSGFATGWTKILSTSYPGSKFVDTGTSIGFMIGYNAGTGSAYHYRSTDGTTFSSYLVSTGTNPMPGGNWSTKIANSLRITNSYVSNTAFVSYDDGITWSTAGIGLGTAAVWNHQDYSGGCLAITGTGVSSKIDVYGNQTAITTSIGNFNTLYPVINDRAFAYTQAGAGPYTYTHYASEPGIFSTSNPTTITYPNLISNPTGDSSQILSFVPFGSGYAMFPGNLTTIAGNTFYTSSNLKTWTARTISLGSYIYQNPSTGKSAVFGNSQGYTGIGTSITGMNGLEVWKSTATLTLS